MVNLPNLLFNVGKKVAKAYSKKEAREHNDTIDEIFTWIDPIPIDARSVNPGEDERVRQWNEEWNWLKEQEMKTRQSQKPDNHSISTKKVENVRTQSLKPITFKDITRGRRPSQEASLNKIREAFRKYNSPREDILYKHPSEITEAELKEAGRYAIYETQNEALKKAFNKKSAAWYDYFYGKDPVKYDETGRMRQPEAKKTLPEEMIEPKTKDGVPLSAVLDEIAHRTAELGVGSLQRGLNSLDKKNTLRSPLKLDGQLGPKTVSRTKAALNNYGVKPVKNGISYGGFSDFVEKNRQKPVDRDSLQSTITAVKPENGGLFLQKSLNEIGKKQPDYTPLKEDNDIGDKTTSAFNSLKDEKENELLNYFETDPRERLDDEEEELPEQDDRMIK